MGTTPDLGLPELTQAQANPDITFNEALVKLQAVLGGVLDKDLTSPPGSPTEGDAYLINTAAPTGLWSGHAYAIAIYWGGSWRFVPGNDDAGTPITMGSRQEGLRVWVRDENKAYVWQNSAGSPLAWHWSTALGVTAADIANVPAGNIAATNVQTALNELDTEKAGLALVNAFTAAQSINLNSAALIADGAGQVVPLHVSSANDTNSRILFDAFGTSTLNVMFRRARTSGAAPSAIQSGDAIAFFGFLGYGASAWGTGGGAQIRALATENGTNTARGTKFEIRPVANGGTAPATALTADQDGGVFIGATTSAGVGTLNAGTGLYVNANVAVDANGLLRGPGFTVGGLPAAAGVAGARTRVTDSNAAITAGIGAVVAGGGANVVPVFSDGVNWRIA